MTSKLTRERLEKIKSWRETYGAGSNVMLPAEEAEELARIALAAMDSSESVELPLDYLQGHKDGLEWAARLAEANHPETGDWLYDDPIELAKAIRKGPDRSPVQPVADSEPDRNPVLAYADSYRDMAKQGVESVPIWSVITDLERNIAPLYRHAQPVPVVPEEKPIPNTLSMYAVDAVAAIAEVKGWNACRTAMLQELKKSAGTEAICRSNENVQVLQANPPAQSDCCPAQKQGWIPVSEQMPEDRTQVILWDAEIGEVTSGHYSHKTHTFYHCGDAIENEITHWMPTPAAPQEMKGE
ncbi:DUF551 domain-containing protein [Klebsiella pneumoniae]|uniref:DUF551 domain-containing protein n=2 Tax=Enterobacterales TaxID=91347 RepID=UPI0010830861|nr:DUF551 domain-containing protein [Klebsiella pneumoniae]ELA0852606.1 DUF551 domain-containing protein [Klebsiella pneumoniae]VGC41610.1 Protein of uncharacterised function (DUF551) [Klebsiella pneumoniae]HEL9777435.1 DUF551 domain-containing protein [Klebsiella pneumoniae]HEL9852331.1 DUF551 domain-containing protein [Klebsiella pneumoniae]